MSTTTPEFVTRVRASGVVSAEQLDEFLASPDVSTNDSPKVILSKLVAAGLVTTFQAGLLRAGKYKGFRLGSYVILDKLGAGGMGQVFRARHATLPKEVAIKVLPPSFKADPVALARFVREARTCAAISHPNIVGVYDVLPDADPPHILMEYVPGLSLQQAVTQRGVFAPGEAADVGVQACTGLQRACEVGLVHRDIKPPNLLLTRAGQVKILDFGIARIKSDDDGGLTMQGKEKAILGTADYLAPEQAVDSSGVDSRADIYAMGATLYFLLAGHPPFPEKSTTAKLLKKQVTDPRPIQLLRPDVPVGLSGTIQQMLSRDPNQRPQTPAAAADLLRHFAHLGPDYPARLFGGPRSSEPTLVTLSDPTVSSNTPQPPASAYSSGVFSVEPTNPPTHSSSSFIVPPASGMFVPAGPGSSFFAPTVGFDTIESRELEELDAAISSSPDLVTKSKSESREGLHPVPADRSIWRLVGFAMVVAVFALGGVVAAFTGMLSSPPQATELETAPVDTRPAGGRTIIPRNRMVSLEPDGFIRDWLLLGPLPLPPDARHGEALKRELIKGQATLTPRADEVVRFGDRDFTWRTCQVPDWGLSFEREFGGNGNNCAAYAVCYVFSPAEQSNLKLKYGSDDLSKIWLNGKEIAAHWHGRGAKVDDSVVEKVSLRKGMNTIVFKIVNGEGPWGGGMRFTDQANQPISNLRISMVP